MLRFLICLGLAFSFLIPISVFAYGTSQDLLKLEKAPPLDSSLLYKFRVDPKQLKSQKDSMMLLWGGPEKYKDCVRLSKEDRLVYLVYLNGITDPGAIETELSSTETFGATALSTEEGLQVKSLGLRQIQTEVSSFSSSEKISNSLTSLRSKGLVK